LTGGGAGAGGYQLGTGAQLKFASGSYTLGSITGNGSVLVAGISTVADVAGGVTAASAAVTAGATLSLGQAASFGSLTIDGGTLSGPGNVTAATLNLLAGTCAGGGDLTASDVNWSGGVIAGDYRNLSLGKVSGDFVLRAPLLAQDDISLAAQNGDLVVAHDVFAGQNLSLGGRNIRIEPDDSEEGALVGAIGNLAITATGALQLLGDHGPAKLLALGTLSVGAQSVLLRAGNYGAGIDPTNLVMTMPGDLVLQGGAGAPAVIVGDTVSILAGNVSLSGGDGGYAAILALAGDLNLATPSTGSVTLTPGSGLDADAVIVAPLSSTARVLSGQCIGCTILGADPFGNLITETGLFAGTVEVTGLIPGAFPPPDNGVIQASVVALTAATSQTLFGAPNDDNNSRKRAIPACPVR
jgi:hypothetical protein